MPEPRRTSVHFGRKISRVRQTSLHTTESRPWARYRGIVVPYITTWSAERSRPATVIQHRRSGVAFADETLSDRDERGVLWQRAPHRPGRGRPEFGKVHPGRQRRAIRELLCQVCARPADRTDLGTLWLIPDYPGYHDDWPGWPERMAATEPPICRACADLAVTACPALRKGHVALRVARSVVKGVYGALYRPGPLVPVPIDDVTIAFDDPAIRWTCAGQLVRELRGCTRVDLDG
jgi:hypothetical protein